MPAPYEILLWDIDQTLLDFNRSMDYALRHTFEQFQIPITDEIVSQYAAINDSYWKRLEKGEVTKKQLLIGRFQDLLKKLGLDGKLTAETVQPVYQEALGSVYFYIEDSFNLCSKLKEKVKQYAVSNGVLVTQMNKLKLSGFDKLMDGIFISEEVGAEKPDYRFFEYCFQHIPNFDKSKALIIGDSLTSDMKGGNTAGIDCCWYNPLKLTRPLELRIDYEIASLWEVEDLI